MPSYCAVGVGLIEHRANSGGRKTGSEELVPAMQRLFRLRQND